MFWKFLIGVLFIYFLVRVIVRFVIPLFRIASAAQSSIHEMKKKMEQMEQKNHIHPRPDHSSGKTEGEYIDYEEIDSKPL